MITLGGSKFIYCDVDDTIMQNFACIDTGGCYKRGPYGRLTALQYPEMIVYTQENIENV